MTRRLLLSFFGLTVVVLVVVVVPFGRTSAEREREDLLARVERDAVAIAFFVEDALDPEATGASTEISPVAVAAAYEARTDGRVVIVDREGIALADSSPPEDEGAGVGRDFSTRSEVATALGGEVAAGSRRSETLGGSVVFVAVPVASGGSVDGAVRITYPTAELDARVRRNWAVLGGLSAITLALAGAVAVLLARGVTGPLRRVQHAAVALGSGDLGARAPVGEGPPEVRSLAVALNQTAGRLEALLTAQDHFVADASHELRTPLTALRLRLESLDGGDDVDAALEEVARLARLVDGLLALARADRVVPGPSDATTVPLAAFLDERREAWEPLAADAEVAIEVSAVGGAAVAHPDRMAQVVDNLVANAIDAAPAGSTVRLLGVVDGEAVIHVVDQGPGLPAEDRERAFDRFWRASANRGRFGGSGLGLAIVAKLVQADGGSVHLDEAPGGGVDAVVRYPAAR